MTVYVREFDDEIGIYLSLSKDLIKDYMSDGLYLPDMKDKFNVTAMVFDPQTAESTDDSSVILWIIIFFSIFFFFFIFFLLLLKRRHITTKKVDQNNDGAKQYNARQMSSEDLFQREIFIVDDAEKKCHIITDCEDIFEENPEIELDVGTCTIDVHRCTSSSCTLCQSRNQATFVDVGKSKAPTNVLPKKWWEL